MEIAEKQREEERDRWFNQARPMTMPKKTWRERRLAREGGLIVLQKLRLLNWF
jgi:hypothetical protein